MASQISAQCVSSASDDIPKRLVYVESKDQFKWNGTFDELSKFVVHLLGTNNGGTSSEDHTHKLFTFKIDDIIVKWYSTTHTIVIQGTGHMSLKRKLLKECEENAQVQITPVDGAEEEIVAAAPINLHTVMRELSVIRQELADLKKLLNPGVTGSTLEQDLEASLKENDELRDEIRIHKDNVCRIEEEKSCLLKALTLMKQSETKVTKETTVRNNRAVSFVGGDESQSTVPGEIVADSQPASVSGDDDEPEISQQIESDWTRVERRRQPRSPELLLIGDSIIKNLDPKKMSKRPMAKRVYRGCKVQDIKTEEDNLPPQGIKAVLIHAGTNNVPVSDDPKGLAQHLDELGSAIQDRESNCEVIVSGIIHRDDTECENNISTSNAEIKKVCRKNKWYFVDNDNIDSSCLNSSGLHLNRKGDSVLASNLIRAIRKKNQPFSNSKDESNSLGQRKRNFQGGRQRSAMWDLLSLLGRIR